MSGVSYSADAGMTFSSLVIIDLGIARVWRDGADADTVKFGTRSYAPPEQYGFGQTSVRSDIYALGALLFFCLTGTDPKPGRDMREQCNTHGIPTPLADAVCMAMALDPAKRFASAKALGHAARAAYELCLPGLSPATPPAANAPCVVVPQVPQPVDPGPSSLADRFPPASPTPSRCARLLSRIPEPVGRIWNGCIYAASLLLLMGSHFAVFSPTGENRNYPTWFLALEYFLMVDGVILLVTFGIIDRRRLRRRFPMLDRYRGSAFVELWLKALAFMAAVMCVVIVVGNATGVVS